MYQVFTLMLAGLMGCLAQVGDVKTLMEEWDQHMRAFVPDDMMSFTVEAGQDEILVETIREATNIRGAYFISLYSKDTMDFQIIDPDGIVIFTKVHKKESVFSLNVTQVGEYQFVFKNIRSKDAKTITFALDVKNSLKESISQEDIDPLEQSATTTITTVMDVFYQNKIGQQRFERGYESMKQANHKIMIMTFVETVVIVVVTVWQIWYIKSLFDSRRLV